MCPLPTLISFLDEEIQAGEENARKDSPGPSLEPRLEVSSPPEESSDNHPSPKSPKAKGKKSQKVEPPPPKQPTPAEEPDPPKKTRNARRKERRKTKAKKKAEKAKNDPKNPEAMSTPEPPPPPTPTTAGLPAAEAPSQSADETSTETTPQESEPTATATPQAPPPDAKEEAKEPPADATPADQPAEPEAKKEEGPEAQLDTQSTEATADHDASSAEVKVETSPAADAPSEPAAEAPPAETAGPESPAESPVEDDKPALVEPEPTGASDATEPGMEAQVSGDIKPEDAGVDEGSPASQEKSPAQEVADDKYEAAVQETEASPDQSGPTESVEPAERVGETKQAEEVNVPETDPASESNRRPAQEQESGNSEEQTGSPQEPNPAPVTKDAPAAALEEAPLAAPENTPSASPEETSAAEPQELPTTALSKADDVLELEPADKTEDRGESVDPPAANEEEPTKVKQDGEVEPALQSFEYEKSPVPLVDEPSPDTKETPGDGPAVESPAANEAAETNPEANSKVETHEAAPQEAGDSPKVDYEPVTEQKAVVEVAEAENDEAGKKPGDTPTTIENPQSSGLIAGGSVEPQVPEAESPKDEPAPEPTEIPVETQESSSAPTDTNEDKQPPVDETSDKDDKPPADEAASESDQPKEEAPPDVPEVKKEPAEQPPAQEPVTKLVAATAPAKDEVEAEGDTLGQNEVSEVAASSEMKATEPPVETPVDPAAEPAAESIIETSSEEEPKPELGTNETREVKEDTPTEDRPADAPAKEQKSDVAAATEEKKEDAASAAEPEGSSEKRVDPADDDEVAPAPKSPEGGEAAVANESTKDGPEESPKELEQVAAPDSSAPTTGATHDNAEEDDVATVDVAGGDTKEPEQAEEGATVTSDVQETSQEFEKEPESKAEPEATTTTETAAGEAADVDAKADDAGDAASISEANNAETRAEVTENAPAPPAESAPPAPEKTPEPDVADGGKADKEQPDQPAVADAAPEATEDKQENETPDIREEEAEKQAGSSEVSGDDTEQEKTEAEAKAEAPAENEPQAVAEKGTEDAAPLVTHEEAETDKAPPSQDDEKPAAGAPVADEPAADGAAADESTAKSDAEPASDDVPTAEENAPVEAQGGDTAADEPSTTAPEVSEESKATKPDEVSDGATAPGAKETDTPATAEDAQAPPAESGSQPPVEDGAKGESADAPPSVPVQEEAAKEEAAELKAEPEAAAVEPNSALSEVRYSEEESTQPKENAAEDKETEEQPKAGPQEEKAVDTTPVEAPEPEETVAEPSETEAAASEPNDTLKEAQDAEEKPTQSENKLVEDRAEDKPQDGKPTEGTPAEIAGPETSGSETVESETLAAESDAKENAAAAPAEPVEGPDAAAEIREPAVPEGEADAKADEAPAEEKLEKVQPTEDSKAEVTEELPAPDGVEGDGANKDAASEIVAAADEPPSETADLANATPVADNENKSAAEQLAEPVEGGGQAESLGPEPNAAVEDTSAAGTPEEAAKSEEKQSPPAGESLEGVPEVKAKHEHTEETSGEEVKNEDPPAPAEIVVKGAETQAPPDKETTPATEGSKELETEAGAEAESPKEKGLPPAAETAEDIEPVAPEAPTGEDPETIDPTEQAAEAEVAKDHAPPKETVIEAKKEETNPPAPAETAEEAPAASNAAEEAVLQPTTEAAVEAKAAETVKNEAPKEEHAPPADNVATTATEAVTAEGPETVKEEAPESVPVVTEAKPAEEVKEPVPVEPVVELVPKIVQEVEPEVFKEPGPEVAKEVIEAAPVAGEPQDGGSDEQPLFTKQVADPEPETAKKVDFAEAKKPEPGEAKEVVPEITIKAHEPSADAVESEPPNDELIPAVPGGVATEAETAPTNAAPDEVVTEKAGPEPVSAEPISTHEEPAKDEAPAEETTKDKEAPKDDPLTAQNRDRVEPERVESKSVTFKDQVITAGAGDKPQEEEESRDEVGAISGDRSAEKAVKGEDQTQPSFPGGTPGVLEHDVGERAPELVPEPVLSVENKEEDREDSQDKEEQVIYASEFHKFNESPEPFELPATPHNDAITLEGDANVSQEGPLPGQDEAVPIDPIEETPIQPFETTSQAYQESDDKLEPADEALVIEASPGASNEPDVAEPDQDVTGKSVSEFPVADIPYEAAVAEVSDGDSHHIDDLATKGEPTTTAQSAVHSPLEAIAADDMLISDFDHGLSADVGEDSLQIEVAVSPQIEQVPEIHVVEGVEAAAVHENKPPENGEPSQDNQEVVMPEHDSPSPMDGNEDTPAKRLEDSEPGEPVFEIRHIPQETSQPEESLVGTEHVAKHDSTALEKSLVLDEGGIVLNSALDSRTEETTAVLERHSSEDQPDQEELASEQYVEESPITQELPLGSVQNSQRKLHGEAPTDISRSVTPEQSMTVEKVVPQGANIQELEIVEDFPAQERSISPVSTSPKDIAIGGHGNNLALAPSPAASPVQSAVELASDVTSYHVGDSVQLPKIEHDDSHVHSPAEVSVFQEPKHDQEQDSAQPYPQDLHQVPPEHIQDPGHSEVFEVNAYTNETPKDVSSLDSSVFDDAPTAGVKNLPLDTTDIIASEPSPIQGEIEQLEASSVLPDIDSREVPPTDLDIPDETQELDPSSEYVVSPITPSSPDVDTIAANFIDATVISTNEDATGFPPQFQVDPLDDFILVETSDGHAPREVDEIEQSGPSHRGPPIDTFHELAKEPNSDVESLDRTRDANDAPHDLSRHPEVNAKTSGDFKDTTVLAAPAVIEREDMSIGEVKKEPTTPFLSPTGDATFVDKTPPVAASEEFEQYLVSIESEHYVKNIYGEDGSGSLGVFKEEVGEPETTNQVVPSPPVLETEVTRGIPIEDKMLISAPGLSDEPEMKHGSQPIATPSVVPPAAEQNVVGIADENYRSFKDTVETPSQPSPHISVDNIEELKPGTTSRASEGTAREEPLMTPDLLSALTTAKEDTDNSGVILQEPQLSFPQKPEAKETLEATLPDSPVRVASNVPLSESFTVVDKESIPEKSSKRANRPLLVSSGTQTEEDSFLTPKLSTRLATFNANDLESRSTTPAVILPDLADPNAFALGRARSVRKQRRMTLRKAEDTVAAAVVIYAATQQLDPPSPPLEPPSGGSHNGQQVESSSKTTEQARESSRASLSDVPGDRSAYGRDVSGAVADLYTDEESKSSRSHRSERSHRHRDHHHHHHHPSKSSSRHDSFEHNHHHHHHRHHSSRSKDTHDSDDHSHRHRRRSRAEGEPSYNPDPDRSAPQIPKRQDSGFADDTARTSSSRKHRTPEERELHREERYLTREYREKERERERGGRDSRDSRDSRETEKTHSDRHSRRSSARYSQSQSSRHSPKENEDAMPAPPPSVPLSKKLFDFRLRNTESVVQHNPVPPPQQQQQQQPKSSGEIRHSTRRGSVSGSGPPSKPAPDSLPRRAHSTRTGGGSYRRSEDLNPDMDADVDVDVPPPPPPHLKHRKSSRDEPSPPPASSSSRRHRRSRPNSARTDAAVSTAATDVPNEPLRASASAATAAAPETREERHLKREERQRARAEAETKKKPTGFRAAMKRIFA